MNDANPAVRRRPLRLRRRLRLAALLLTTLPAAGWAAYLEWWPRRLCTQLQEQLARADDGDVGRWIARIDGLGRRGLAPLTDQLASQRPAVARAAYDALSVRVARLGKQGSDAWNEAEAFAAELERSAERLPVERRGPHVRLAMQLLEVSGRLRLDGPPLTGHDRVLPVCERLLREAPSALLVPNVVRDDRAPAAALSPAVAAAPPAPKPAELPPIVASDARLAAGHDAESPATAATPTEPPDAPQAKDGPQLPPTGAANSAARVNPIRAESDARAAAAVRRASVWAPAERRPVDPPPVEMPQPFDPPSPAALAARTAWSLFADLALGGEAAATANAELHRRGFRPGEIALGRRFAEAGPEERRRLVESLPSQPGIDVRPWLAHLSEDDDPGVRLAAVTIMATSNDPQLLAVVRRLAVADADEQVRRQAARVTTDRARR